MVVSCGLYLVHLDVVCKSVIILFGSADQTGKVAKHKQMLFWTSKQKKLSSKIKIALSWRNDADQSHKKLPTIGRWSVLIDTHENTWKSGVCVWGGGLM